MNDDYFDLVERGLRDAVARRAHLRWYARVRLPVRNRGLAVVLAALVVATPAVAAVGAASGWFSKGKPDFYYPASSTSALGKATPGTRMLSIRVPDPDGGPPWGLRLVKTNRGATCLQVGRVEYGTLGSLGIDYSWGDDHKFHPISPNDELADICGATDGAGNGFVSSSGHGWPASAYTPSDSGKGIAATYCQAASPLARLRSMLKLFPKGSRSRAAFEQHLKIVEAGLTRSKIHPCPKGSLRMIFAGLLGPDAKSITYRTPSGQTRTEDTVGGDGAYLIVFKQTAANCNDFSATLDSSGGGCDSNYGASQYPDLRQPNAVTSVTYRDGRICSDEPSSSFVAAYKAFSARMRTREEHEPAKRVRQQWDAFYRSQGLAPKDWFQAENPQCGPVGWVAPKQQKLTASQVAAPVKVTVVEARRYCTNGPKDQPYRGKVVACDNGIPAGYRVFPLYGNGDHQSGPPTAWVTTSFVARQPVASKNSWYEWQIDSPDNGGSQGGQTNYDIRRGRRISFSTFVQEQRSGVYTGVVSFFQNVGKQGINGGDDPGRDGSIVVGRFSFRLPTGP